MLPSSRVQPGATDNELKAINDTVEDIPGLLITTSS